MGIPFRWSPTKHIPRDINTVNALLRNESWQKVVVYRDPMERFLSAFNSKCLMGDHDGKEHCHKPLGLKHPTIPAVADRLANGPLVCDPHWIPMARFCGGTVGSAWEQYTHHVFLHHLDARVSEIFKKRVPAATWTNIEFYLNTSRFNKKGHITHAEDALAKVSIRTRMQIIDYYWEDYRLLLAHDEEQTTEVGAR